MAIIISTLLVLAAVGFTASSNTAGAAGTPGVTKTEIRVGGLASPPNDTLDVAYPDGFDGTKAYFDKINKAGGLFGKKLKLVAQLNDQGQVSANVQATKSLVEEKKVFAVIPIMTNSFTLGGRYLSQKNVPSFGINVDPAWCGSTDEEAAVETAIIQRQQVTQCPRQNLFGEKGSFLCFECPGIAPSYIAKQKGLTKAALFTYTHISSAKCGNGTRKGFQEQGIQIVHENLTLQFGFAVSELAADVADMKAKGVQFVATCMDFGGAFKIAQALKQAGDNDVWFYAPEGYKNSKLKKYGSQLNHWIFRLGFTPWQDQNLPKGTKEFLAAMKKIGKEPTEHNQAGWINAALLVQGIKLAGKNFTQQSVIAAINGITDFTADGILPPIDWSKNGHGPGHEACDAYVEALNGKFIPRYGKPGQPFVCFPDNPRPPNLDHPYFLPLKAGETRPAGAGP
jgi:ABC-type branched-subunit amino acid transport system substrate-binding protein